MNSENGTMNELATSRGWAVAAWVSAAVAGLFCLVLGMAMVGVLLADKLENPLAAERLAEMKKALATRPADDGLKGAIQQEDMAVRGRFWLRRGKLREGAWLMLGGGIVLVVAVKAGRQLGKRGPTAEEVRGRARDVAAARWAVMGTGVAMAGLMVMAAVGGRTVTLAALPRVEPQKSTPLPDGTGEAVVEAPATRPSAEGLAANWPVFRGWGATNVLKQGPAWPVTWDGDAGTNVLWKSKVPLRGQNSPVVWGDKVFLTGATETEREVYCFGLADGKMLWKAAVGRMGQGTYTIIEDTGHAAPTCAVDGVRVYAIFASGDLVALDMAGRKVWQKCLGLPDSMYGYAASLALHEGKVIVQWDVGTAGDEKVSSALVAFDGATGKVVWQVKRPMPASWSSPTVVRTPSGEQLITCGSPWIDAYNPATGKELWRVKMLDQDVATTPVCVDGVLYVAQEHACIAAIRTDGQGDVTETHVVWKKEDEGLPDTVSPVVAEGLLFTAHANGTVYCFDAKDGTKLWEKGHRRLFHASPVVVDGRMGLIDTKGTMHWFAAARECKELGTAELGEGVSATPAFVGGKMIVRGWSHLYCIGGKP